jgi:hypothetical protein
LTLHFPFWSIKDLLFEIKLVCLVAGLSIDCCQQFYSSNLSIFITHVELSTGNYFWLKIGRVGFLKSNSPRPSALVEFLFLFVSFQESSVWIEMLKVGKKPVLVFFPIWISLLIYRLEIFYWHVQMTVNLRDDVLLVFWSWRMSASLYHIGRLVGWRRWNCRRWNYQKTLMHRVQLSWEKDVAFLGRWLSSKEV